LLNVPSKEYSVAENKTKPTVASVAGFLKKIPDVQLREDCFALVDLMESVSKTKAVMWGSAIIGFGTYHYVYESGREGDSVIIGFSPRKQNIAIYLKGGLSPLKDELPKLGKHKTGGGCLYIKALKDVDAAMLKKILTKSFKSANQK
jgi:hypothetical protein